MGKNKRVPAIRFKGFTEEWEEKKLEQIVELFSGLTYSPSNIQNNEGTLVLRSSNVKESMVVSADDVYVSSEVVNSDNVRLGDIIVVVRNGSRSLIGKHALIDQAMHNTVIGAFMTGIRYKNPRFMNALLHTKHFDNEIRQNLGATINQITNGALKSMQFYIPKVDNEQIQIGNFFQNIDKLIETNQRKINKLKNIKKACLEKMFPRKGATISEIRFKGFTGEWEEKIMGKIGNTFTGLSGKTKNDFGHGDAEFITYMNVFTNPITNRIGTERVEIDKKQNQVQYGDIFFTTSSETPEEVGMSSVWLNSNKNVYLNSFCFGYRLNDKEDCYYLAYLLRCPSIRKKITFLAQGISRYNISKNKMMEIELPFPDIDEQEKIGNFFKNLDNLIAKNEQQLEKLKNIKKACLEKMFVNKEDAI